MSTAAQVAANRANAQLSTGPRSAAGKSASSRNALKLGIHAQSLVIPGEDPEELEELARGYQRDLAPDGAIETALVETMVRAVWMMRRMTRIEAEVVHARLAAQENPGAHPLGDIYIDDAAAGRLFQTLARRYQSLQRDYYRALNEIRETQRERAEASMQASMFAAMARPTAPPSEERLRFSNPAAVPPLPDFSSPVNPALRLQSAPQCPSGAPIRTSLSAPPA